MSRVWALQRGSQTSFSAGLHLVHDFPWEHPMRLGCANASTYVGGESTHGL